MLNMRKVILAAPMRKVVEAVLYRSPSCPQAGIGSYQILLECGHHVYRKGSQGIPRRAHCLECYRAQMTRHGYGGKHTT